MADQAKSPDAFKTISEVAEDLDLPQHVLRFWETRFKQVKPMKRGGGRRYYRPEDVSLLKGIRFLLYAQGYTIKGVQRILKEQGSRAVISAPEGGFALATDTPQKSAVSISEITRGETGAGASASGMRESLQGALSELLECKRLLDQVR
ncbi:MerR family transcriptional regulator [Ahrensia sp. R2A130]|uniref:MerR family transcriptional regulator n=1 Tax=Ahrensia sp. R2A130 TaxID=744979 RepID=UPI0001E083B0|nr:MerR family transcriptional regulator [Ahrensia sp. R2A130]EFL90516.1 transcriptional regulator, MerR family [Ahrensia sp. R2A130]